MSCRSSLGIYDGCTTCSILGKYGASSLSASALPLSHRMETLTRKLDAMSEPFNLLTQRI